MAIRIRPAGMTAAYGQLGKLAGEARASQQKAERIQRQVEALQQIKWQRERMLLDHQWDVEAYNRAKQWDIEKMEIASRMDFQREEQDRQQKMAEMKAKEKAIMESDILSDEEKKLWLTQLRTDLPVATSSQTRPVSPSQQWRDYKASLMLKGLGGSQEPLTRTPQPTTIPSVSTPKQLDLATARMLIREAGGDKNKAKELARQRGYVW